jgi:hypothetical protein
MPVLPAYKGKTGYLWLEKNGVKSNYKPIKLLPSS